MNMPIRLTPTVKFLMIACFGAFVVQQTGDQFFGTHLRDWFALVPADVIIGFRLWQLVTYSFLHGDVMHLFLNLLMLAFIGSELEALWGRARFLRYYFFCVVFAALTYLVLQLLVYQANVPMVGASGGIYGLLVAYGLLFGERVMLFMLLFPMKAKHFVWILAAIEFMSSIFAGRNALASVAHLGGMAGGFLLLWGRAAWKVFRRRQQEDQEVRRKEKRRKSSQHLKLVINNPKDDSKRTGKGDDQDSDGSPKTWH